jgi:hypothetical protein
MVWSGSQRSEHRVDIFLADLDIPRLISTSRDLNMANCELSISAFFVFLEDTDDDDEVLTRFLAGVRRCWLRAHFIVVFPERWNPTARDHKCELKATPISDLICVIEQVGVAVKVHSYRFGQNTFNSEYFRGFLSPSIRPP